MKSTTSRSRLVSWRDGFACRSEDMAEKGCSHAHGEGNFHQSGEGELEEHKRPSLREEAYRLK